MVNYDYSAAVSGAQIFLSLLRRADSTQLAEKLEEAVRVAAINDELRQAQEREAVRLREEIKTLNDQKVEAERKLRDYADLALEYTAKAAEAKQAYESAQAEYDGFLKRLGAK
jgi:chromosome segregation ATPase